MFGVVAAVDLYHGFVPWCQRSEILKHYPDGSFDAELEIGFKFLVESYISHVELNRPKFLKVTDFLSVFVVVIKIVFALFFRWKIYCITSSIIAFL